MRWSSPTPTKVALSASLGGLVMRVIIARSALAGLLILGGGTCEGEDRWVIRFHSFANPAGIPGEPCTYISWADRLVLRNTTTQPATVRLLGVSNGQVSSSAGD